MSDTINQLPIQFRTHIFKLNRLNLNCLELSAAIVQQIGGLKCGRLLCTVNNKLTFQCGLMALGMGNAYISISSKRMQHLQVKLGDEVLVYLQKDDSEYGTDFPEELKELLAQDDEGKKRFHMLKPGMQRYILHYVSAVKNSQLRIERSILLIENLKCLLVGKETFRDILGKK